jgi:DNA-binding transcriptional regulator YhcF (GntR family)
MTDDFMVRRATELRDERKYREAVRIIMVAIREMKAAGLSREEIAGMLWYVGEMVGESLEGRP